RAAGPRWFSSRASSRTVRRGRPEPRRAAGRPGPLEVVASDRAEGVQDFAAQKEARRDAALHGGRFDFVQTDAASGDLGLRVALVAAPWQLRADQGLDPAAALAPGQLSQTPPGIEAGRGPECGDQALGEARPYDSRDGPGAGSAKALLPAALVQVAPPD